MSRVREFAIILARRHNPKLNLFRLSNAASIAVVVKSSNAIISLYDFAPQFELPVVPLKSFTLHKHFRPGGKTRPSAI